MSIYSNIKTNKIKENDKKKDKKRQWKEWRSKLDKKTNEIKC
jgi:hypothetical protein